MTPHPNFPPPIHYIVPSVTSTWLERVVISHMAIQVGMNNEDRMTLGAAVAIAPVELEESAKD